MSDYPARIDGEIDADEVIIGKGVVVEPGAIIRGKSGRAKRVILGDFCYIGGNVKVLAPEFRLGDYSKLHSGTFAHGIKPLQIGRNCWIGGDCVLDSMGGLDIDDNVGIGAQSQLWTHIRFGDVVEGSRFHSTTYMHIKKDAWFVGHCIVSPVKVGERSLALVGSVITKDMQPNHVYGGVPARDLTDRMGPQFETLTVDEKAERLRHLIDEFESQHPEYAGKLEVVTNSSERPAGRPWLDVSTRTYAKSYHPAEVAFLKANVPIVKFIADDESSFIDLDLSGQAG
jgi:acetyltransferase-like isoleucine patch superfamily enzyme